MTPEDIKKLAEPFRPDLVSWRAQSLTKDGTKALALAYIDARDVMNRLDQVCGPENWSDSHVETPLGRIITTISIKIDGEWVSKSDGAGKTDIEGDKGGLSDGYKRAAVKWGIGRYLYDIESPWVPCESSEWNGKKQWKRWTVDPWTCVRGGAPQRQANGPELSDSDKAMLGAIEARETVLELEKLWKQHEPAIDHSDNKEAILAAFRARKAAIQLMDKVAA